jgi:hypothetical protein
MKTPKLSQGRVPLSFLAILGILSTVGCSSTPMHKSSPISDRSNVGELSPVHTEVSEEIQSFLRRLDPPLPPEFEDRTTWRDYDDVDYQKVHDS